LVTFAVFNVVALVGLLNSLRAVARGMIRLLVRR
jgi:hypothetical protein